MLQLFLKEKCTKASCNRWHPPECVTHTTNEGCKFGDTCAFLHSSKCGAPNKTKTKRGSKSDKPTLPVVHCIQKLGSASQDIESLPEPTVGLAVAALVGDASPPSGDTTVVGAASFACSGADSPPPQLAANASSALTTTMLNRVVLMLHSMNDRQPRARGSFPRPPLTGSDVATTRPGV